MLTIDLYLNDETIESLNIDNSTGRIMLDDGLFFNDVFIKNSTGDIKIYSSIYDNLEISNTTGDIYIKDIDDLIQMLFGCFRKFFCTFLTQLKLYHKV